MLKKHLDSEGLFRKSGSFTRQKEIKETLSMNFDPSQLEVLSAYDLSDLIKLFLRELPEPLFTSRLQGFFLVCSSIGQCELIQTQLMLCLLLPRPHLHLLRYLCHQLYIVSEHSPMNHMNATNISICLAPNMFKLSHSLHNADLKLAQKQADVLKILVENHNLIGMLTDDIVAKVTEMSLKQQRINSSFLESTNFEGCIHFGDENISKEIDLSCRDVDVGCHVDDVAGCRGGDAEAGGRTSRMKKRSTSLQGLVKDISANFTRWRSSSNKRQQSLTSTPQQLSTNNLREKSTLQSRSQHPTALLQQHEKHQHDLAITEGHNLFKRRIKRAILTNVMPDVVPINNGNNNNKLHNNIDNINMDNITAKNHKVKLLNDINSNFHNRINICDNVQRGHYNFNVMNSNNDNDNDNILNENTNASGCNSISALHRDFMKSTQFYLSRPVTCPPTTFTSTFLYNFKNEFATTSSTKISIARGVTAGTTLTTTTSCATYLASTQDCIG
ncbi:hypothetical protein HELRODRAFT_172479 [Helobdella robusta]|uniref:Rho-GAP domain-containing protein n=1 Tax=Helobdella robusta TaxID=6412 RepID=T1F5D6_HELRO|nr:hypothetical protein HELRODRAFT_172479 [Helobdella robusta]ESO04804.1 hypothetical protein HELRODRAFT_172479 [Helobdella robusta]